MEYLYDIIDHDKNSTISEHLVKNLHQLITQNIEKEWAGKYRNAPVIIGGAKHRPPDSLKIPYLMRDLIKWLQENQKKLHPVELAALLHHKFVHIHPFFDGNGRTARLLMNLYLLMNGYPLVIILKNDRKKYYRVLQEADDGKFEEYVRFIAGSVDRSLTIYLEAIQPTKKNNQEKFITLAQASKTCRYSAKYLNLLAGKGELEAHKVGRNWVTTQEAIKKYLENRKRIRNDTV